MACTPGMTACLRRNVTCGHAARIADYREFRQWWELRREADNPGMYPTEVAEWTDANPAPTLREFLIQTARPV